MDTEVKWIKVSVNLFDDEKIKQIRSLPDGNNMILIWLQLLLLAGKTNQEGSLVITNTEIPYTEEMLSVHFDMPLNTVLMAVETFKRFGMIEIIDDIYHITNWLKYQSEDDSDLSQIRENNRERVKRFRNKQKLIQDQTEPKKLPQPKEAEPEAVYQLVLNDKSYFGVTQEMIDQWKGLYPAVDVDQEIRKMIGWCDANPKNRKTRTGAKRFINSWLSRAQNRAPSVRQDSVFIPNPGLEEWN